jgi:hypothetical protein
MKNFMNMWLFADGDESEDDEEEIDEGPHL